MVERRPEAPAPPAPEPADDAGYSEEEEAEVRKCLEDLGASSESLAARRRVVVVDTRNALTGLPGDNIVRL